MTRGVRYLYETSAALLVLLYSKCATKSLNSHSTNTETSIFSIELTTLRQIELHFRQSEISTGLVERKSESNWQSLQSKDRLDHERIARMSGY